MVKLYVDGIFACLKTNPNVNNAEQFLALNRSSRFTLINNMLEQLSNINNKKSLNELLKSTALSYGDELSSKVKLGYCKRVKEWQH
jgi:hypothetical protein